MDNVIFPKLIIEKEKTTSKSVNLIFVNALVIRLIMLVVIVLFSEKMESGFISSNYKVDDWRYLEGALQYSNSANSFIDYSAFNNSYAALGDWVGYNIKNAGIFTATPLWYFICCGIVYITKSTISVRLTTVLFSSISIIYIYKYAIYIYNEKVAFLSARLFAYLPFTVIFSCFAYKDHLFLLLIFFLYAKAAEFRVFRKLSKKEYAQLSAVILSMFLLRSGFTVLIVAVAFYIAINPNLKKMNFKQKTFLLTAIVFLGGICFVFKSVIEYKIGAYINGRDEELASNTISILTVNSITDVYKLPFTYLFATISPIGANKKIESWCNIVANSNYLLCPISVGSFFYFFEKKKNRMIYLCTLSLFLITIITSVNIFRHYYSLMPFIMIYFSDFWIKANKDKKYLCLFSSLIYALVVFCFLGLRN